MVQTLKCRFPQKNCASKQLVFRVQASSIIDGLTPLEVFRGIQSLGAKGMDYGSGTV